MATSRKSFLVSSVLLAIWAFFEWLQCFCIVLVSATVFGAFCPVQVTFLFHKRVVLTPDDCIVQLIARLDCLRLKLILQAQYSSACILGPLPLGNFASAPSFAGEPMIGSELRQLHASEVLRKNISFKLVKSGVTRAASWINVI